MSFISLPSEINTQELNKMLIKKHSLFLPSFCNQSYVFKVNSENELSQLSTYRDCFSEQIIFYPKIILVPGLAFSTKTNFRLGRGKGWYDRYLSLLPNSSLSIGIGFQEQKFDKIPVDLHDVSLKKLFLF